MKRIFFILFIFLIPAAASASPLISTFETDGAQVISKAAERYIDTQNRALSKKCGAQIIVATVKSTGELTLAEYADELYKNLGMKSFEKSNSVLIVMCTGKRDYTVIVSDGISRALTMSYAERCFAEYMEKDFSKKDYSADAVKTYNGFAKWYNDNYNNVSLEITDDLSEYESIIDSEEKKQHRRIVNRSAAVAVSVLAFVIIIMYVRRRLRIVKAQRKRRERRMDYLRKIHKS